MLSPRWKKVQRDLWTNRARTLLVVASIAVGIFAVGVVQHIRTVVLDEMQTVYDQSNAAHYPRITSTDHFSRPDPDLLSGMHHLAADGYFPR